MFLATQSATKSRFGKHKLFQPVVIQSINLLLIIILPPLPVCLFLWVSSIILVCFVFSRGQATLQSTPCRVGRSVRRSVGHISKLRSVFALLLLPNRPRLDCRVSGLVFLQSCLDKLQKMKKKNKKSRPDTRQSSRGRLGRSSNSLWTKWGE